MGTVMLALALSGGPVAAVRVALPTAVDGNAHPQAVAALPAGKFGFVRLRNGVQVRVNDMVKTILFYGPATVRVNTNDGRNYWTAKSIVVTAPPADVPFTLVDAGEVLTLATAKLKLSINKSTGAVSFFDAEGKPYTGEDAAQPQSVKPVTISNAPSYEVENRFTLRPDEAIYGFGFTDDATINRRGPSST